MRPILRPLLRSLSFRLLVPLVCAIAAVAGVYGLLTVRTVNNQWTYLMESCADRTSELVKAATYYGMLLNRKEDVHRTVERIAAMPGMAGIRVYDKNGSIVFSADSDEIGHAVDMEADACVSCHSGAEPLATVPEGGRTRIFNAHGTGRAVGLINPIANDAECTTGACHAHSKGQSILGVLDVQLSLAGMDSALDSIRWQTTLATLIMTVILVAGAAWLIRRFVQKPVGQLREGTRKVAAGDLESHIAICSDDEIGELGLAFNTMTDDLRHARAELTEWSRTLEQRVVKKTEQLGRIQRQMVHMDKMASLGRLSATVAHELNNPLAGILNYAKLVGRTLRDIDLPEAIRAEVTRYVGVIEKESSRSGSIVRNLLLFARESPANLAPVHVNEIVERSLMLVRHHIELHEIELDSRLLEGDDEVVCDGNQIQQAVVALLVNAAEAMSGMKGGLLEVRLSADPVEVRIDVEDNGSGIAADDLEHVFEPFFSTKEKESGVGLGLAVVYGIIQQHGGTIDVESTVGHGTTIHVTVPRHPPERAERPMEAAAP